MNHVNKLIFIVGMQGTTVWWLHDTQFREPKVYIYCDIQSDLVQQSSINHNIQVSGNTLTPSYRQLF